MTDRERTALAGFGCWLEKAPIAQHFFDREEVARLAPMFKAVEQGGSVTQEMIKAYDTVRDLLD